MAHSQRDEPIILGRVTSVFGVKGWVKVHSYTEPKENILNYGNWLLAAANTGACARTWQKAKVVAGQKHGKALIVQFEGSNDRDSAQGFCASDIAIEQAELPSLEEGNYYWHQLEGLRVISQDEQGNDCLLGEVSYMMATGANDVLVVKGCKDSIDEAERLLPYIEGQVIKEVDIAAGVIRVDWDPEF